jgi:prepilin-type N-terminal cleavage/methylation domain-containing protein
MANNSQVDTISHEKHAANVASDSRLSLSGHVRTARLRRATPGFSMIEALISMAIIAVVAGISIIEIQPTLQRWHANTAMYEVLGQLRWARQESIAERRDIQVQFLGTNEIKLIRQNEPAGQTVLSDLFLTGSTTFRLTPGLPDTPDAFGNASPIEFAGVAGGPPIMQFQSDGTFVDGNGNPINGTVFLGIPQVTYAARAVTILGATGRVRTFSSIGSGWVQ